MPGLADAIDEVIEGIAQLVEGDVTSGGSLEDVESVIRGDRFRGQVPTPSIWVIPEVASNQPDIYGLTEAWILPVTLAALVKADEPETGRQECLRLAAQARRAVLQNRKLDLDYVLDTTSLTFDALARSDERNRNLHWAHARIQVVFTVDEDDS